MYRPGNWSPWDTASLSPAEKFKYLSIREGNEIRSSVVGKVDEHVVIRSTTRKWGWAECEERRH